LFGPFQQNIIAITTSINKQGHVTMASGVQCTIKYPRGARENAATVYKQNLKKERKKKSHKEGSKVIETHTSRRTVRVKYQRLRMVPRARFWLSQLHSLSHLLSIL